jgi:hypothetical protein
VAMELPDLQLRGLLAQSPLPEPEPSLTRGIQLQGEEYLVRVMSAGPVSGTSATAASGALVLLTWTGPADVQLPPLEPVKDLEPFHRRSTAGDPPKI